MYVGFSISLVGEDNAVVGMQGLLSIPPINPTT